MLRTMQKNNGFSLVELLMSASILLIVIVGILITFLRYMELNEMSNNTSIAMNAAKVQMENIRNTTFGQIVSTYNNSTFTDSDLTGIGICYVDSSDPELLQVTVNFSWQENNGRILGEDLDLDGILDLGEDINGNSQLDSPVSLVTYIYEG